MVLIRQNRMMLMIGNMLVLDFIPAWRCSFYADCLCLLFKKDNTRQHNRRPIILHLKERDWISPALA